MQKVKFLILYSTTFGLELDPGRKKNPLSEKLASAINFTMLYKI